MNDDMTLQELAISNGLTNIQIVALNGIGQDIADGKDWYESYEGTLSEAEDAYLKKWIKTYAKS